MKETLTRESAAFSVFTCPVSTDIKIKGDFVGLIWLESQIASEDSTNDPWDRVPNTMVDNKSQFALDINDSTMKYRFNSRLQSGEAIVYASGVTSEDAALLGGVATTFAGDTDVSL